MSGALFYLSSAAIALTLITHTLLILGRAMKNTTLEYYGRLIAFFTALLICASYGTVASIFLSLTGYGGLGQWTTSKSFKWTMLLFAGVWFDIDDPKDYLNKTRPAVFIGNHQTELDILFLGAIFPKYCSVTAKRSLQYIPFLGWFMTFSKTVFIDRASRTQAFAAFTKAAAMMHSEKQSVFLFPEGTRSYYDQPDLLQFKKGAFHLAIQAQVPIVPVVAANYSNILNFKRKIFRAGIIPVKVLPPIETKGKTKDDVESLLEQARESMLAALKAITGNARQEGVALKKDESGSGTANGSAKSTAIDEGINAAA